jgi:simple sugar transport system ATP-binding protein
VARVELHCVHKRFGATAALAGAELSLERGEVHALLGENGAGKSTLMRVLYGLVRPDRGELRVDDRAVEIRSPSHALELGIGLVHQHFMGVPTLSVAENLWLGESHGWWIGRRELRERAAEILERFGLDVDPDTRAGELGVAQQQRLEIVRALARGVDVLVLDEPTAVLAPSEVDGLLRLLGELRESGHTIVFISHKLDEITAVSDRVTVLRAGRTVATLPVEGLRAQELGRLMVGDALPPAGRPLERSPGATALRLAGLRAEGLRGIDLQVSRGEIVALAGIDGNGQTPLEEVLAGVRPLRGGRVEVLAPPLSVISGDRQETGLVLELAVEENLLLVEAARSSGWIDRRALREESVAAIRRFGIHARPGSLAGELSGGNQQKLQIARALRASPGVLIAVNPTRGLDVTSTAAVRDRLREEAREGAGVLLISTDLDEVLELGTRISVLFRGRLLPVEPSRRTRERIGELMLGGAAA